MTFIVLPAYCLYFSIGSLFTSGVADGVGGWREYGIDPSQFPRTLMSICERLVKEGLFEPRKPKDIISKGYDEIQEYKEEITGILQMKIFSVFAL